MQAVTALLLHAYVCIPESSDPGRDGGERLKHFPPALAVLL